MIRSMTGFARSLFESQDISMTVEIRALNSKNLELNLRLPYSYRSWEDELRTAIKPQLLRGKVDVNLNVKQQGAAAAAELNKDVISDYIQQLREIAEVNPAELLPIATRLPDALQSAEVLPDDNQKKEIFGLVQQAIKQLIDYQTVEGQAMTKDLNAQIESIEEGLEQVNNTKDHRIQQVQSKLQDNLKSLKKLGFITQEIGREINTIGSKANDASLQKQIVQMKDALERIKEQLLNIL